MPADSSRPMVGSATLTIVLSMPTSSTLKHSAASAHQRCVAAGVARCRGPVRVRWPGAWEVEVIAGPFVERRSIVIEQCSITVRTGCQAPDEEGRENATTVSYTHLRAHETV